MTIKLTSIGRLIQETQRSHRDLQRLAERIGAEPHEERDGIPYFAEPEADRLRVASRPTRPQESTR